MQTQQNEKLQERINFFAQKAGENEKAYQDFLILIAQPLLFSTDFLYKLWLNFKGYNNPKDSKKQPSYLVVSDFILSGLCQPIGTDLFRMEDEIREYLLSKTTKQLRQDVALFIEEYAIRNKSNLSRNIFEIHSLFAKGILYPSEMEKEIIEKLKSDTNPNEKANYLNLYFNSLPFGENGTQKAGISLVRVDNPNEENVLTLGYLPKGIEKEVVNSTNNLYDNFTLSELQNQTYIFLFGTSKHADNQLSKMPNVEANIKQLEQLFVKEQGIKKDNIRSFLNRTGDDIKHELLMFLNDIPRKSTFIFYFAGHGVLGEDYELYFAASNSHVQTIKGTGVSAIFVREMVIKSRIDRKVIILDCCFSERFTDNIDTVELQTRELHKKIKSTFIMTSSKRNTPSMFDPSKPNNPTFFTESIIKTLKEGINNNQDFLNALDIYENAKYLYDKSEVKLPKSTHTSINDGNNIILAVNNFKLKNREELNEAKLIFVGVGEVGKTELTKALSEPNYSFEKGRETTIGIRTKTWKFSNYSEEQEKVNFTAHIWDFAGQEINYGTHQFFLTKNAVYVFVWETRKGEDQSKFAYWLRTISLYSKNAPILVVQNKIDELESEVNQKQWQEQFPNIVGFYKTSCKEGTGIDMLRTEIQKQLLQLPHTREIWSKTRIAVRDELLEISKNIDYISYKNYLEVCEKNNVSKEDAIFLSYQLHNIGSILHLSEEARLKNTVVLNIEWITDATYLLLDTRKVKNGHFRFSDLDAIWNEKRFDEKHEFLINLIEKFELIFQFQDSDSYIIPEGLPIEEPKEVAEIQPTAKDEYLRFQYHYPFLPKGILNRFICRLHENILEDYFWKYGVLLVLEKETFARVILNDVENPKTIKIEVWGEHADRLLSLVCSNFEHIHNRFEGLDIFEKIPCNCEECEKLEKPYLHDYDKLQKKKEKGKVTTECPNSGYDVVIDSLINKSTYHPKGKNQDLTQKPLENSFNSREKEIEGLKKNIELLLEKLTFLLQERLKTSNAKLKFNLTKELETIEEEIENYRKELKKLEDIEKIQSENNFCSSQQFAILFDNSKKESYIFFVKDIEANKEKLSNHEKKLFSQLRNKFVHQDKSFDEKQWKEDFMQFLSALTINIEIHFISMVDNNTINLLDKNNENIKLAYRYIKGLKIGKFFNVMNEINLSKDDKIFLDNCYKVLSQDTYNESIISDLELFSLSLMDKQTIETVVATESRIKKRPLLKLTEIEILEKLYLTNSEIAKNIYLSQSAVEARLDKLYKKFEMNRTELYAWWVTNKLYYSNEYNSFIVDKSNVESVEVPLLRSIEIEVLKELNLGNAEIADKLLISKKGLESRLEKLYKKFEMNRIELYAWWITNKDFYLDEDNNLIIDK